VNVTAATCDAAFVRDGGNFTVNVNGFGSVMVDFQGICECDCTPDVVCCTLIRITAFCLHLIVCLFQDENSPVCGGNGNLVCGACQCSRGRCVALKV